MRAAAWLSAVTGELHCPAVLALELSVPAPAVLPQLPTEQAALLVDAMAADLARLLPGVEQLGLAVAGALFDPAQVLRPGWPLFAELSALYGRRQNAAAAPAVVGFGAAGGRMASAVLEPEPGFGGGTLLLVPFVLVGEAAAAQAIGTRMEQDFNETGLAGAAVPLFLGQALGLQVAHARYLTRHDLCALTAIQLEHAGLGAVWSLLEAALLAPGAVQFARSAGGTPWRYADGAVRAGAFGFGTWVAGPGATLAAEQRSEAFAETLLTQRRAAALLGAHALAPAWVAIDPALADGEAEAALATGAVLPNAWVIEVLQPRSASAARVAAIAHRALGRAGCVVLEATDDGGRRVIARLWPLAEDALRTGAAALGVQFDASHDPRPVSLVTALGG